MYLLLIFCVALIQITRGQEFVSKCPDILEYDDSRSTDGRWYGKITLDSEYPLSGYWLEIELANKTEVVGIESKQILSTKDNKNYVIVSRDKLEPGKPVTVSIFVKYDEYYPPFPEVNTIHLNGRKLCPAPDPVPVGISPCPGVFSYDPDQTEASGKWFGTIALNLEYDIRGLFLEFHLNAKADLVGAFNYRIKHLNNQEVPYWNFFGDIKTKDNQVYSISNSSFVLLHGHVLTIPFFVKYDLLSGIPLVNTVVVNGRVICQGSIKDFTPQIPLVIASEELGQIPAARIQTTQRPAASLYTPNGVGSGARRPDAFQVDPVIIPDVDEEDEQTWNSNDGYRCGVPELADKVIGGSTTMIRMYPWHGIIFRNGKYICGMTLISRKHAISAAHCFYIQKDVVANRSSLAFRFGVDNLSNRYNGDAQNGRLSELHMHPNYMYHLPKFDIAVVKFANQVKITETVTPICLWSGENSLREIQDKTGTIVGFGQTEHGGLSNILREAKLLVVDSETCRDSDPQFYGNFLSRNSFCAGNISTVPDEAVSPCFGDSGGGLSFKKPGTEIWEIRGVVSTSQPTRDQRTCVSSVYAIFTDVAKFNDWILSMMLK